MPLLDYTTKVPVSRTIAQIHAKLAEHGAHKIMTEYDQGKVSALAFEIETPNGAVPIRVPIDTGATLKVLQRQYYNREIPGRYANEGHAYRVAWRNVKDWIEAQLALLDTEMVRMEQVFLPYIITGSGQTVFEVMAGKHFLLGPGEKDE